MVTPLKGVQGLQSLIKSVASHEGCLDGPRCRYSTQGDNEGGGGGAGREWIGIGFLTEMFYTWYHSMLNCVYIHRHRLA